MTGLCFRLTGAPTFTPEMTYVPPVTTAPTERATRFRVPWEHFRSTRVWTRSTTANRVPLAAGATSLRTEAATPLLSAIRATSVLEDPLLPLLLTASRDTPVQLGTSAWRELSCQKVVRLERTTETSGSRTARIVWPDRCVTRTI